MFKDKIETWRHYILLDKLLLRLEELKDKTVDQQIELKKVWAIEDGLTKVADSIRSKPERSKFLGIF